MKTILTSFVIMCEQTFMHDSWKHQGIFHWFHNKRTLMGKRKCRPGILVSSPCHKRHPQTCRRCDSAPFRSYFLSKSQESQSLCEKLSPENAYNMDKGNNRRCQIEMSAWLFSRLKQTDKISRCCSFIMNSAFCVLTPSKRSCKPEAKPAACTPWTHHHL